MLVRHLMKRNVWTCRAGDSLKRAAEIMSHGDCGTLPVVDEKGRVVAIVTDRDLCMAACRDDRRPIATHVSEVAERHVVTITENATADEAEHFMRVNCVRRLPVVDDQRRPVGILSLYDLARQAHRAATKGDCLTPESVVTTEIAVGKRATRSR